MDNYIHRNYEGLSTAIYFLAKKYTNISIPLKPNFYYDLIIEADNQLLKVKLISTDSKAPSGSYIATLRKSGGYSGKKELKEKFKKDNSDFLFIITPDHNYFIPSREINTKRSISLSMYATYKLAP